GETTDPWFDRAYVATDDPSFVRTAVVNLRQGAIDAQTAEDKLGNAELRAAAGKIRQQNENTVRRLEQIAADKGWRLPEPNALLVSTFVTRGVGPTRANANFILNQIAFHQNMVQLCRAQLAGTKNAELRSALNEALPGYQENLLLLLKVKP